jgi:hypothetical protein
MRPWQDIALAPFLLNTPLDFLHLVWAQRPRIVIPLGEFRKRAVEDEGRGFLGIGGREE